MTRHRILPLAFLVLLAPSACTVKETRTDCPCYVTLDLDDFALLQDYDTGKVGMHSGTEMSQEDFTPSQYLGRGYETSVRRLPCVFFSVVGQEGLNMCSDTLKVSVGSEWPRVMADSAAGECSGFGTSQAYPPQGILHSLSRGRGQGFLRRRGGI